MIAPQSFLRAMSPKVYDLVQKYRVTVDALMPLAYQNIPGGRPLHNDWAIFKDTPRMSTAYRVPLPFKQTKGACEKRWMLWDPSYPASPGLQTEVRADGYTYALVDCAVEGSGAAEFSAWLGDCWVPVFTSYRRVIFGRLLASYSGGLKQDVTVVPMPGGLVKSDLMGWWDPPSVSYNVPS